MGTLGFSLGLMALLWALPSQAFAEGATPEQKPRDSISPNETGSLPRGFHVETRPRYGPIIGGAITTCFGGLLLAAGINQHNERPARGTNGVGGEPGSGGEFLYIPGAVALAVGLPLLSYGLLSPRELYVRDTPSNVQVGFSVDQRHVSAGLTYAF